jgi:hypothetical protein
MRGQNLDIFAEDASARPGLDTRAWLRDDSRSQEATCPSFMRMFSR